MNQQKSKEPKSTKSPIRTACVLPAFILSSASVLRVVYAFAVGGLWPLLVFFGVWGLLAEVISITSRSLQEKGYYWEPLMISIVSNVVSIGLGLTAYLLGLLFLGPMDPTTPFFPRVVVAAFICLIGCVAYLLPGLVYGTFRRRRINQ